MTANYDTTQTAHEEALASEQIMRAEYKKHGNEHLLVRAVVFTLPADYVASNEVFSPLAFAGIDRRSKMISFPCEVAYPYHGHEVTVSFFRALWRFNQEMVNPLTTITRPSHQDESLNALNAAFLRMNANR